MKSSIVSVLALALGSTVVAAVTACEGEPPKTAEAPLGATPQLPVPEESASATAAAVPETAATCCECQCPGGQVAATGKDAGAPVAVAGDAGAAEGGAMVAAAPAHGDIEGDVVTTPAYLKAASVVYLEDAPTEGRGMTARIENRQMAFFPPVQVVTVGGSVSFINSDPFPHNVFSGDRERFDLGLVQPGHSITHKFANAGPYTLLCNLHPNMIGYLVVSPSSYFARTDAKGHYKIKDVPPGTYKITAWAPRLATATDSVTLKGPLATTNFELHR